MDPVLVIHSDAHIRELLVVACRARGRDATGVSRVADIAQWPRAHVVATDLIHLTPWWSQVGASRVIALVSTDGEAAVALINGATDWIRWEGRGDVVTALIELPAAV